MYTQILIPLDGSRLSEKALPHAQGLAKSYGATVHLLQVFTHHPSGGQPRLENPGAGLGSGGGESTGTALAGWSASTSTGSGGSHPSTLELARQLREAQIEEAEEYLEHVATQLKNEGIAVETELHEGASHEHIVEYAKQHSVDLIVMSTHGHGGVKRFFMGSTTDRVIRAGEIPVLVVT